MDLGSDASHTRFNGYNHIYTCKASVKFSRSIFSPKINSNLSIASSRLRLNLMF